MRLESGLGLRSIYEDNPNVWHWIKIKNPDYSQKEGRADLFKRTGKPEAD